MFNLYNYETRHIAGQTAGPIELKFFVDTHGWTGCFIGKKIRFLKNIFFKFFFKNFSRATSGPSANFKY